MPIIGPEEQKFLDWKKRQEKLGLVKMTVTLARPKIEEFLREWSNASPEAQEALLARNPLDELDAVEREAFFTELNGVNDLLERGEGQLIWSSKNSDECTWPEGI